MREHYVDADVWHCPVDVTESLLLYWHRRIPTGGFLEAVLANDLREAVGRADSVNIRCIPGIVRFITQQLPAESWGSRKAVEAWLHG